MDKRNYLLACIGLVVLEIFEEWKMEGIQSVIADFNGLRVFHGFFFFEKKFYGF